MTGSCRVAPRSCPVEHGQVKPVLRLAPRGSRLCKANCLATCPSLRHTTWHCSSLWSSASRQQLHVIPRQRHEAWVLQMHTGAGAACGAACRLQCLLRTPLVIAEWRVGLQAAAPRLPLRPLCQQPGSFDVALPVMCPQMASLWRCMQCVTCMNPHCMNSLQAEQHWSDREQPT